MRVGIVGAAVVACAFALAGCGSDGGDAGPAAAAARPTACPSEWRAGWKRLAQRAGVPVYCPTWMPHPLDARIGGEWTNVNDVDDDGSYLVSFIYQEANTGEVHVNFRRYPGTAMPRCRASDSKRMIPCFSDPAGRLRVGDIDATLYTVGRDADEWHLSYLWRDGGATYVVGEHVAPPFSHAQVKRNVDRILRGLVRIEP